MNFNIKNKLMILYWILYGKYFSLNAIFKKKDAKAFTHFSENEKHGGSIIIKIGKMNYYFEGKPEIESYPDMDGNTIVKKTLKYGGWEREF